MITKFSAWCNNNVLISVIECQQHYTVVIISTARLCTLWPQSWKHSFEVQAWQRSAQPLLTCTAAVLREAPGHWPTSRVSFSTVFVRVLNVVFHKRVHIIFYCVPPTEPTHQKTRYPLKRWATSRKQRRKQRGAADPELHLRAEAHVVVIAVDDADIWYSSNGIGSSTESRRGGEKKTWMKR